jgi:hypothetical protein
MNTLHKKAFGGLLFVLAAMAALLFIPAGTIDYWQAWTFLAVYFSLSLALTLYLMKNDPKLLERWIRGGPTAEKEPAQKIIMSFTTLGFIGLLVVPALDHRFGWSHMTSYAALAGDLLVAIGGFAIFFVFKENTFTSATIELAADQRVISTGLYALVRHPMYAGALVMPRRDTDRARFMVGATRHRRNHPRADMEIVGRGKIPGKKSAGLCGVPT